MLLNCIRHKAGLSRRRCSGDIVSLPFSEDPCEDCVKTADGRERGELLGMNRNSSSSRRRTNMKMEWMELLERGDLCQLATPPNCPTHSTILSVNSTTSSCPSSASSSAFPSGKMPSIFSTWRPKLQIRLKRLPRSDGPSTDEEEADEEQDERVTKRRLALENNDFIVDSAPSSVRLRRHENGKPRAVRFCEDQPPLLSPLSAPSVLAPFPAPIALQQFPSPKHSSPSHSIVPLLCNANGQIGANGETTKTVPMNGGGVENVQPPRPARSGSSSGMQKPTIAATSRATFLLQQLRERKDDEVGFETHANGEETSPGGHLSYVFLEFQGETKRSALPTNVRSVEQIKSLFLRSFPSLRPAQLRSPGVKVYIQNAHSPHRLFYELEDIREVGNHSVLKLFEQSLAASSSPRASTAVLPTRPPRSVPIEEYFSEPDMANWTVSMRTVEHDALRPASVQPQLDEQNHRKSNGPTAIGWREQASNSWQSSSAYSSDSSTSGPYARSGTTTPVHIREDQHTQRKVDSLERQLASLSELVRSALFPSRELSNAHWRELSQFHTDIVGFSGNSPAGIGPMSESVSSTASNATLPLEKCMTVQSNSRKVKLPAELAAIRADLEALRRETIRNALRGRTLLEQTLDRMRTAKGWPKTEQDELEQRKEVCTTRLEQLQRALREFEQALENTRSSVLNSTRRLHLNEVDELTSKLGEIGREAVEMKMEMPSLHHDIEEKMRRMMERLEGEERFLREKVPLVDGCLRRCKTLANVMVTMKKLAMVQDERGGEGRAMRRSVPNRHNAIQHSRASTVPKAANCNGIQQQHNHPLDEILDELSGQPNGL